MEQESTRKQLEDLLAPLADNPNTVTEFQHLQAQAQEMLTRIKNLEETYGNVYGQVTNLNKKLEEAKESTLPN